MASQTTNNSNESDSKNSNNKTHSVNHSTNETSNGKVNITTIDIPEMKVHVMESKFGSKNSSKRDSKNSSKRSSPGNSPFPSPLSGSRFTSFIPIINPAQTGARGELTSNEICLFVRFLKIGHIDTKNQRFVAHIEIVARWKPVYSTLFSEFVVENRDKVIIPESEDNVEQVRRILPKINVNNLEAIISDRVHYKLKPYPCPNTGASTRPIHMRSIDVAYVEMFRTLKGVFFEYLELEDFPFDVQDICVRFTLDPSCAHYFKLKVAPPGTPAGLLDTHTIFQDAQEWDLSLMAVNGENNVDALGARAASDPPSPDHELVVRTNVRRKSAYHLYNCFLVMNSEK
ncbi:uncharacterized protein LOC134846718 [Symsagittifera roscoffensis]|uniref:uncharacterized protein LOC134846718 n=1 Tax=Symsagittifera roscoffensis TaxID=84072 RepID=UPI00307CC31F